MLGAWLDWMRICVHRKCEGLSDEGAYQAPLPQSPLMSIAGIVNHLRWTEHWWFEHNMGDCSCLGPDEGGDAEDPDADFRVEGVPLDTLLGQYDAACAGARAVAGGLELSARAHEPSAGADQVSLRWVIMHMVEETARHLGHMDAIREIVDGVTGD
ncbi:MAG: mini-circle protein [Pseudonocardiales bacterium]|nr:MAG: mini-circle protein [Pseudonocardiales bacterium]